MPYKFQQAENIGWRPCPFLTKECSCCCKILLLILLLLLLLLLFFLLLFVLLLLLRWHYSPVRSFAFLINVSWSGVFFAIYFLFSILHFLISVCTQFHHLLFGRPLSPLHWWLLLNDWLIFLLLSILLTWPNQFNRLILTNDSSSKPSNSCSNSLLYRFLQFLFNVNPPNVLL